MRKIWKRLIRRLARASADPVIELFQPTRTVLIQEQQSQLVERETTEECSEPDETNEG